MNLFRLNQNIPPMGWGHAGLVRGTLAQDFATLVRQRQPT